MSAGVPERSAVWPRRAWPCPTPEVLVQRNLCRVATEAVSGNARRHAVGGGARKCLSIVEPVAKMALASAAGVSDGHVPAFETRPSSHRAERPMPP